MRNTVPKKPADRRRRTKETRQELDPDRGVVAPELPDAANYRPATRTWYRAWCDAPQAQRFTSTEWQRLHMLAPLIDEYFRAPKAALMAEIRLNESMLGATEVDRARLRWDMKEPEKPATQQPRSKSRRKGLVVMEGGKAAG